ncbi:hypothetical protein [Pseudomonas mosselii]|uniref:hypothetical protein n=1 Tax=Pseudomonas mosselii TaxID=78327 RepID=UPI0021D7DBBB|nr:hypothetical protein [Pseudomonas mosselii]MCU9529384.1 hypothetical protein [Pseudomonas mosselii]MCU9536675.1 hypothetical protein [Pseudomonas mosselii]MCU9542296.1 hypothetical protein [Pseudomonas mosselii]MCU9548400.1 hypothetical protein [Pseudomonas mosselii]
MSAPLTILAAALNRVQTDPAASVLPAKAQAERAALLVLGRTAEAADEDEFVYRSPLVSYIRELQRAKEGLQRALAALEYEGDIPQVRKDLLFANFERSEAVYYQASANVAELVRRMMEQPAAVAMVEVSEDGWDQGPI